MELVLRASDRGALADAQAAAPRVRRWRRYQAVPLLAEGHPPGEVATARGGGGASVSHWAAAWRQAGSAGVPEGDPGGGRPVLEAPGAAALAELFAQDPQAFGHHATGWTGPLLRTELARRGDTPRDKTVRRGLHRRGYRGKRPTYVLGRPAPADAEKRGA